MIWTTIIDNRAVRHRRPPGAPPRHFFRIGFRAEIWNLDQVMAVVPNWRQIV